MVTGRVKAVAISCEFCGYEDVLVRKNARLFPILDLFPTSLGHCPKCGGKMRVDPSKIIVS